MAAVAMIWSPASALATNISSGLWGRNEDLERHTIQDDEMTRGAISGRYSGHCWLLDVDHFRLIHDEGTQQDDLLDDFTAQ